jgi:hypothetical protein
LIDHFSGGDNPWLKNIEPNKPVPLLHISDQFHFLIGHYLLSLFLQGLE